MKKFIYYLTVPFQDVSFRLFFIVLTVKLFSFTYVHDLGSEGFFPAFGAIMMGLAFSLLISRKALKISYLLFLDLVCSLIFFSNSLHLKYFGDYATLNNLLQIGQLTAVTDMIVKMSGKEMFYLADFFCAPLLLVWRRGNGTTGFNDKLRAFMILFLTAVCLNSNTLISLVKTNDFDSIFYRHFFVKKLGIMNYQITDAYYYFVKETGKTPSGEDVKLVHEWLSAKMHGKARNNELTGTGNGMNLIIIQVESLQGFVINRKYHGKEITPNLNALAGKGIYFKNIYDQAGYGNSSDATLLVNASLFPSRKGAACFLYAQNCFDSLPKLLKSMGYSTATMHANVKQFWNSEVFEKSLGFDRQYYKDDYIMVDRLGWGLSDKAFFSQSMEKIEALRPPFYAFLRTLSSHGPFDQFSSEDADDYPLYELDGELMGHYLRAMHYVDAAIGDFLGRLAENNLYSNTMIIIYGDHRAHLSDDDVRKIGVSDPRENMKIPLLIYIPRQRQGEQRKTIGGLIDVAPTISNILGIDISDRFFFGKDLGNQGRSFVIFRDSSYLASESSIHESEVRRLLEVSDTILEKDIITIMKHSQPCNGDTKNAENSHALRVAGRGIPGGQGR
jgi:phosphoglycerol transferase MdoB-like AlkP superfamily enzyme